MYSTCRSKLYSRSHPFSNRQIKALSRVDRPFRRMFCSTYISWTRVSVANADVNHLRAGILSHKLLYITPLNDSVRFDSGSIRSVRFEQSCLHLAFDVHFDSFPGTPLCQNALCICFSAPLCSAAISNSSESSF